MTTLSLRPRVSTDMADFDYLPVVTPLVVESTEAVLNDIESPLLSAAAEMRHAVKEATGVPIPGVRFRISTEIEDNAYAILIREVEVASGAVRPGEIFCPDGAKVTAVLGWAVDAQPADKPFQGSDRGLWVGVEHRSKLDAAQVPAWAVHDYIVRHVEAAIRHRLVDFFGFDQLDDWLDPRQATDWLSHAGDEDWSPIWAPSAEHVADPAAKALLLRMLHALLAEGVPIHDQAALLDEFSGVRTRRDVETAVAAARLRMQRDLPGNDEETVRYGLGPSFEDAVASAVVDTPEGKVLDLAPELTAALLSAVRAVVTSTENDRRDVAIMTTDPDLRPRVRELVEIEFPIVAVLAVPELRSDIPQRLAGRIGCEVEPVPATPEQELAQELPDLGPTAARYVDYMVRGFLDDLTEELRTEVFLDDEALENSYSRGYYLFTEGDYEGAKGVFERLVDVEPWRAHYRRALGAVHQQMGEYAAAIDAYTGAISADETDVVSHVYRGECRVLIGDRQAAAEDFRHVVSLQRDDPSDPWAARSELLLERQAADHG